MKAAIKDEARKQAWAKKARFENPQDGRTWNIRLPMGSSI
jgi:hypothetical protein